MKRSDPRDALKRGACSCLLAACFLTPGPAPALDSDKEQTVYIEADSVEIDDRTGISVYIGNVELIQGSIRMTADRVTLTQKEGKSDHVLAVGNPVTFQQKTEKKGELIKGRAMRAEYDLASDVIYMMDDAVLSQSGDTFMNDRITYDRSREVVRAGASEQGQQRVRITIRPDREPTAR